MSTYPSGRYGECNGGVTKIETESKKQRMPIGKNALPVSILTPTAKQVPFQWQCSAMYLGEGK